MPRAAVTGARLPRITTIVLGVVFLGAMSVLRRALLLVLIPIGVAGVWRVGKGTSSTMARLVTLVTYVAIPLPYDAIARGRWGGLLLWAAAPWLVLVLARRLGTPLFDGGQRGLRPLPHVALGLPSIDVV